MKNPLLNYYNKWLSISLWSNYELVYLSERIYKLLYLSCLIQYLNLPWFVIRHFQNNIACMWTATLEKRRGALNCNTVDVFKVTHYLLINLFIRFNHLKMIRNICSQAFSFLFFKIPIFNQILSTEHELLKVLLD